MDAKKMGEFLAALRKADGLTQQEVADRLGVTAKAVSKWETGGGFPDIGTLPALAELFGVTIDELLAGERLPRGAEDKNAERKIREQAALLIENRMTDVKKLLWIALGFALNGLLLFLILSSLTRSAPISCGTSLIFCVTGGILFAVAVSLILKTAGDAPRVAFGESALFSHVSSTLRFAGIVAFVLIFVAAYSAILFCDSGENGFMALQAPGKIIFILLVSIGLGALGTRVLTGAVKTSIR